MYFTPRDLDFGTGIEEMKAINNWMMFGVKYLYIISTNPENKIFLAFHWVFSTLISSEQGGKILGERVLQGILLGYAF